ncbi:hypothetical protein CGCF415_v008167 [Colletotrichum fructicola]|uniref:UbiD family decarboxylase n=1 Tax=Colletotrichum fructicola (strain Nara gc5) TaxID=1213859 RepID=L2G2S9_COLFN|nr:uncharacterized protein CGMCC3_g3093 [Colletotrichum fructicola]KAF4491117.1 hypothetical protein CGGC5_v001089 [Colletotrichum fructicola Nara gc5]KAE9581135.1 hypothetical protein CGMCC3_g3093 [Colletotrichum fructicola]KAF4898239.1 hypothetical protein CGCFRS4_v004560 [Colletotrichum fructicola]KAF4905707.1 hypothetical protein CGCF415_v008167 [Colletotrichum fructicola]KAF4938024.1 hypothetical protein CGCF245_v005117 [Colletotrichum fructicola]
MVDLGVNGIDANIESSIRRTVRFGSAWLHPVTNMGNPVEMTAECWVWYCLAMTAVVIRFTSQYIVRKRKFIKEIPPDDILMLLLSITYTTAIVALFLYFEIVSDVDLDNITAEDNFVVGRKLGILNILAETSMQTTLWGNKCCILLLYHRLTLFCHHRRMWVLVSAYVALAYVAVIVALYGGWCRPFSGYLVLEPDNMECLTWLHYNSLQLSLNLSTDLILLIIPVVLISRLNMKIGKKILLVCLFSLGIFVMLAAILTKVSVFTNQTAPIWFLWCVREVSTAMLVGNLPLCMPTFRMWWRFFFPGSGASATPGPHESASGASAVTKRSVATTAAFSEATGGGGESSTWGSSPARSRMNDDIVMYGTSKGGASGEGRRLSVDEESV